MAGRHNDIKAASPPLWIICVIIAAVQISWAGYAFGVGNQSIQIPFLLHLRDPSLFASDDLISTLPAYPGLFFPILARLLPSFWPIETVYRLLHFVVTWATLLGGARLAAGLSGRRCAGVVMALLMAAGHHRGLAESGLYALGFTHTGIAIALGLIALSLAVQGRAVPAFLVAGMLLHIHAMHGAFIGLMLGAWSLAAWPRLGTQRILFAWATGLALALPAVAGVPETGGSFDAAWLRLVRNRSAHHVFPSEWWRAGDPQIPRLAVLGGLAALAWSVRTPCRRGETWALVAVPILVGLAGWWFAEVHPVPIIVRLQLLRSSVFLAALLLAITAGALDAAFRYGMVLLRRRAFSKGAFTLFASAATGAVLALPAFADARAAIMAGLAFLLLSAGRLSTPAAATVALAGLAHTLGAVRLGLPWFAIPRGGWLQGASGTAPIAALSSAAIGMLLSCAFVRAGRRTAAVAIGVLLALYLGLDDLVAPDRPAFVGNDWIDIQRITAQRTPLDARILTPTVPGGFRIHSRRAVVAEWRDGTQQFFDPAFAERWWRRMERIRHNAGNRAGGDLADLPEEEILRIAEEEGADFVVLPTHRDAQLLEIARNATWALYRAAPKPPPPPDAIAAPDIVWAEQERFLREVVWPNIERYRQRDLTLRLLDESGRPLTDVTVRIRQIKHLFGFGSSLPHFHPPAGIGRGFRAPLVDPRQLPLFLDLFNYSVISFSGKWENIEPERGKPDYRDLDAYIEWCHQHGVAVEFHFVTGYPPAWLKDLPLEEQRAELLRHANALIDRYGDRVAAWQIVNERVLLPFAPDVFRLFRERLPHVPLGVSNCSRFYSERTGAARREEMLNGWREIEWLRGQGVEPDYFGYHGHRPFQLWADLRNVYEAFDEFQKMGLRVRLTEFGISPLGPIIGPVRRGVWTPELQAEYYRLIYLTAFSHPAVDAVNIWGIEPRTWMAGAGLLDAEFRPKPAYEALRKLIRDELTTALARRIPLDGVVRFRGFYGDYHIELDQDRLRASGTFHLRPDTPAEITVRLQADGHLAIAPSP